MTNIRAVYIVCIALFCSSNISAMEYGSTDNGAEIVHEFSFARDEMKEMKKSAFKAQKYAHKMMKIIWTLKAGVKEGITGSNVGFLIGDVGLAFKLSKMAREEWSNGNRSLGVKIKSSKSRAGKIVIQMLDKTAGVWRSIVSGAKGSVLKN